MTGYAPPAGEADRDDFFTGGRSFYTQRVDDALAEIALVHGTIKHKATHFFYAAGWKKFEAAWNTVIRAGQLSRMTPLFEAVLSRVTAESRPSARAL